MTTPLSLLVVLESKLYILVIKFQIYKLLSKTLKNDLTDECGKAVDRRVGVNLSLSPALRAKAGA